MRLRNSLGLVSTLRLRRKKSRSRLNIETQEKKSLGLVSSLRLRKKKSRSRLDIETQKKKSLGLVSSLRFLKMRTQSQSRTQKSGLAILWSKVQTISSFPYEGFPNTECPIKKLTYFKWFVTGKMKMNYFDQ